MACRNDYKTETVNIATDKTPTSIQESVVATTAERFLFGVDSKIQANDLLQNNIEEFEWIVRNKIYPNFYGRYITGENCLTDDEIRFLHHNGCKIAPIYADEGEKKTEKEGKILAKKIGIRTLELGIPEGTAIFLEIDENKGVTSEFMRGFAKSLIVEGYTPGFKANTDSKFTFDREFSKGMQADQEIFKMCLIWAKTPCLEEYEGITTTHLIHPDTWIPYAPSCLARKEISIWQYGKNCHPVEDDNGNLTTFNLDLVRNEQVIIEKMF